MIPNLYLTELLSWLKTNTEWTKFQKFKLVLWLLSWVYTTGAVVLFSAASIVEDLPWIFAGMYLLNYPALWLFKPNIVRNLAIYWRNPHANS